MKMVQLFALLTSLLLVSTGVEAVGGDFTLTADDNRPYQLSDSRGRAVVISFGFTSCPDVCPTALATVASALNSLGDDAAQVDALFISLDPDRDTPEHLREYTRFFHPQIRGLTGDPAELRAVADDYHVRYSFVGKGRTDRYTLDHSANLFVIDTHGKVLRIVPHGMPPQVLADGLRMALSMARNETAGNGRVP